MFIYICRDLFPYKEKEKPKPKSLHTKEQQKNPIPKKPIWTQVLSLAYLEKVMQE